MGDVKVWLLGIILQLWLWLCVLYISWRCEKVNLSPWADLILLISRIPKVSSQDIVQNMSIGAVYSWENGLRFSFCGNCSYVMFRGILSLRFLTIMGYFWQNTYKDEILTVIFCKNVEIWTMLRKQLCNIKETGREMGAYNASYILYDSLLFQYTMPYVNTMYYVSCSKMLILR